MYVTVTGALVVFVNMPLILPVPLMVPDTSPVWSRIHSNTVPETLPEKVTGVTDVPLQMVWIDREAKASGTGLTKTVEVTDVPMQPVAEDTGVMVNVTVTGALVVFNRTPLISPEPLVAIPVTVTPWSRVQLYVVPVPVRIMVVMFEPLHIFCDCGVAVATGRSSTVIVLFAEDEHPLTLVTVTL